MSKIASRRGRNLTARAGRRTARLARRPESEQEREGGLEKLGIPDVLDVVMVDG